MIEIYKTLHHKNPLFLSELFYRREIRHYLRIKDTVLLPSTSTMAFGMKSICFRGSILWNSIPDVIKSSDMVASFCKKIKHGLVKDAIVNYAVYFKHYLVLYFRLNSWFLLAHFFKSTSYYLVFNTNCK